MDNRGLGCRAARTYCFGFFRLPLDPPLLQFPVVELPLLRAPLADPPLLEPPLLDHPLLELLPPSSAIHVRMLRPAAWCTVNPSNRDSGVLRRSWKSRGQRLVLLSLWMSGRLSV